ncbi:MAG TPA: hypothetical protein VMV00_00590 [Candidatus Baltobacteraceae bacterium]|nr:hypothetical protein [Candidatus Baltobacteraceae bacterium]
MDEMKERVVKTPLVERISSTVRGISMRLSNVDTTPITAATGTCGCNNLASCWQCAASLLLRVVPVAAHGIRHMMRKNGSDRETHK